MLDVEHLGDELERAASVLHAVRATRVLEQLERLLERRERGQRLGLGFRLGLRFGSSSRDRDERERGTRDGEQAGEDEQDRQKNRWRDPVRRGSGRTRDRRATAGCSRTPDGSRLIAANLE